MLRSIGKFFWRFMVIFSFIVNVVLLVVVIGLVVFIFQIKNEIAGPLVGGLYTTAVGLEKATIDWTIPVRDRIPVRLNIPLQTETKVILTEAVPLTGLRATIDLPGLNATGVSATVSLTLPEGLELPVALDLNVPVDEELDVSLDVRAVIPLGETQLVDPVRNLQLLFQPLAIALHNLPNDFGQAGTFLGDILGGKPVDKLLFSTDGSGFNAEPFNPWPGFSQTAGLNYDLMGEPVPSQNVPLPTGIEQLGGIPLLDSMVRPELYQDGNTPASINAQAIQNLSAQGLDMSAYNGELAAQYQAAQAQNLPLPPSQNTGDTQPGVFPTLDPAIGGFDSSGGSQPQPTPDGSDLGIMQPTPGG